MPTSAFAVTWSPHERALDKHSGVDEEARYYREEDIASSPYMLGGSSGGELEMFGRRAPAGSAAAAHYGPGRHAPFFAPAAGARDARRAPCSAARRRWRHAASYRRSQPVGLLRRQPLIGQFPRAWHARRPARQFLHIAWFLLRRDGEGERGPSVRLRPYRHSLAGATLMLAALPSRRRRELHHAELDAVKTMAACFTPPPRRFRAGLFFF